MTLEEYRRIASAVIKQFPHLAASANAPKSFAVAATRLALSISPKDCWDLAAIAAGNDHVVDEDGHPLHRDVQLSSRTKTEFRAIREICGITQAALAKTLGVEVRSVKRWESDAAPQQPPADAWVVLDDALAVQRRIVDYALAKVDETGAPAVRLPYWSNTEDFATHSTDARLGVSLDAESFRRANANTRALAAVLMAEGMPIVWTCGPLGDAGVDQHGFALNAPCVPLRAEHDGGEPDRFAAKP